MLGALHAKARLNNELRQPLQKIQRFGQQMNALLEMKGKYGAGYIQAGYSSAQQAWEMKQKYRPPRYTACLNQLLNAPRYINNMNSFRQFRLKLEKHQKTAATLKIVIF